MNALIMVRFLKKKSFYNHLGLTPQMCKLRLCKSMHSKFFSRTTSSLYEHFMQSSKVHAQGVRNGYNFGDRSLL